MINGTNLYNDMLALMLNDRNMLLISTVQNIRDDLFAFIATNHDLAIQFIELHVVNLLKKSWLRHAKRFRASLPFGLFCPDKPS